MPDEPEGANVKEQTFFYKQNIHLLKIQVGYRYSVFMTNTHQVFISGRLFKTTYGMPVLIYPSPIRSIHTGGAHLYFTTFDGKIFGMGCNEDHQIPIQGNYSERQLASPVEISANFFHNSSVITLQVGAYHALFVTKSGRIYTFGWNELCQTGFPKSLFTDCQCLPMDISLQLEISRGSIEVCPFLDICGDSMVVMVRLQGDAARLFSLLESFVKESHTLSDILLKCDR